MTENLIISLLGSILATILMRAKIPSWLRVTKSRIGFYFKRKAAIVSVTSSKYSHLIFFTNVAMFMLILTATIQVASVLKPGAQESVIKLLVGFNPLLIAILLITFYIIALLWFLDRMISQMGAEIIFDDYFDAIEKTFLVENHSKYSEYLVKKANISKGDELECILKFAEANLPPDFKIPRLIQALVGFGKALEVDAQQK